MKSVIRESVRGLVVSSCFLACSSCDSQAKPSTPARPVSLVATPDARQSIETTTCDRTTCGANKVCSNGVCVPLMACYEPGATPPTAPFDYNQALRGNCTNPPNALDRMTCTGGVQLGSASQFQTFMGKTPGPQAAEMFASNADDAVFPKWNARLSALPARDQLVGCNSLAWTEDEAAGTCQSSFAAPSGPWAGGKLSEWKFGPCIGSDCKALNLDFGTGLHGEMGVMSGSGMNNKSAAIPDDSKGKWMNNVVLAASPEATGGAVAYLDTYVEWRNGTWVPLGSGAMISGRKFASGSYEVRARVENRPGLVWAIWSFFGNYQSPALYSRDQCPDKDCGKCVACGFKEECLKNKGPGAPCQDVDCESRPSYGQVDDAKALCAGGASNDPMWTQPARSQLAGYPCTTSVNHEIDIELPANAPPQTKPCTNDDPCVGLLNANTMNLNAYRWTNSDGTGTYNNLFVVNNDGPFMGDGKYHRYRFDWHTGDTNKGIAPRVDFFFDGEYIGTNDAMVPTMASRLWVMQWPKSRSNGSWNGRIGDGLGPSIGSVKAGQQPDSCWAAGGPTSPCRYSRVEVDYIRIDPFAEANDNYFPEALDQPDMACAIEENKDPGCCALAEIGGETRCLRWASADSCEYGRMPAKEHTSQTFVPYVSDNGRSLGSICDERAGPCDQACDAAPGKALSCRNGGTCVADKGCACTDGFTGPLCDLPCQQSGYPSCTSQSSAGCMAHGSDTTTRNLWCASGGDTGAYCREDNGACHCGAGYQPRDPKTGSGPCVKTGS